jgi:hypothetical protein
MKKRLLHCSGFRRRMLFRSGGTSLSGQSVTDGILVDLSQHWNKINIENAGAIVPENAGCCGMAGDRGFLFPALTAAATAPEAKEVNQQSYNGYYSSTKTCEMAMSEAVKENYESILYLVDDAL